MGKCKRRPRRLGMRYEEENSYMERLCGADGTVGNYAGYGQGEAESAIVTPAAVDGLVDAAAGTFLGVHTWLEKWGHLEVQGS